MPCFSVDTKDEAQQLQTLLCRLQYDGRYVLNEFGGELADLRLAAETIREAWERMGRNP